MRNIHMPINLPLSTLISISIHTILLVGLLKVVDVSLLPKIQSSLEVTLVTAPKTPQTEQAAARPSSSTQPRQNAPVMASKGKTTYTVPRSYADETVVARYAHHTRRRVISASTHESRDAQYLADWREMVEQQGTQLYRADPQVRDHQGELRVLVAIAADGSLAEVSIRASSGDVALDNLAIDIVKSAAPFKPLPAEVSKDTDVLEIIRTWRFTHDTITMRE